MKPFARRTKTSGNKAAPTCRAWLHDEFFILGPSDPGSMLQGVQNMQDLLVATFLAFAPASLVIAHPGDLTVQGTGTAFAIAEQFAEGGPYGGAASGHTGTALDAAWYSLRFPGSPDLIAADWPMPPVVAKGE